MAVGLVDYNTMVSIGDAIRLKLETDNTYAPYEMADAIKSIQNEGGGGGTGFNNEYIVAYMPLSNTTYNYDIPWMVNNFIEDIVITNELPDDIIWSKKVDWPGMSKGNVYCFSNNAYYPYEGATYMYPYTFGFYLEDGDEDSKLSILDMKDMFKYKYNLKHVMPIGDFCIDMHNIYAGCNNLIDPPVCGPNVQTMSNAYYQCQKIPGPPVCGESVTNMEYAYYYCNNLTGAPAVGPNVVDMSYAYCNCVNLIGDGLCPDTVYRAGYAYYNCKGLVNGYYGANVINATCMYENSNIIRAIVNDGARNLVGAFANCANLKEISLPDSLVSMFNSFFNCISLSVDAIIPDNVMSAINAYGGCGNLLSVTCPNNLYVMTGTYSKAWGTPMSSAVTPVCGENVIDMGYAYNGQNQITGSPVMSQHVRNAYSAYNNCTNLTGSPVLPDSLGDNNIMNLPFDIYSLPSEVYLDYSYWDPNRPSTHSTYENCYRLTGSPVVPPLMNNMTRTYYNCSNLTGNPAGSPNLVNAENLYFNCRNLTGSVNMGTQSVLMKNTFNNAVNVSTVYLPGADTVRAATYFVGAFTRNAFDTRLNVILDNYSSYSSLQSGASSVFGGYLSETSTTPTDIECEGEIIHAVRCAYNSTRNQYLYCTV